MMRRLSPFLRAATAATARRQLQPRHQPISHFKSCYSYSTVSGEAPLSSWPPKPSKPLRILFCGSDDFSCEALRALHAEHRRNADLIRSIDVLVRPAKPTGRGLKVVRQPPSRILAQELGLAVHERDTFTGWEMPHPGGEPINLIVAVSFGLLVPKRLLRAAHYGGLNVHPSLLPDLRGPAPLHHALLAGRTHTGVSLQTLAEDKFDAGAILAQTSRPGLAIPAGCTVEQLHALLAPLGASMLVSGLRAGVHVPPVIAVVPPERRTGLIPRAPLLHAPKITAAHRQVPWVPIPSGGPGPSAQDMARRAHVLGQLWTHARPSHTGLKMRMILDGVDVAPRDEWPADAAAFARLAAAQLREKQQRQRETNPSQTQPQSKKKKKDRVPEIEIDLDQIRAAGGSLADKPLKTVTWLQMPVADLTGSTNDARDEALVKVRTPYFVDDAAGSRQRSAVLVPMAGGGGGFLRIRAIKVEGDRSRAAAEAIRAFTEEEPVDSGLVSFFDGDVFQLLDPLTSWFEDLDVF
ncbi:formyl transferase [Lasiosphaeria miniovina]|uniref:methionyl-tRNA formyltransferase n=1 Tax=Lasiosphaeria miniovina TaxID=1954250 RepID=A0AA40B3L4_9PEZI|nr:formyl transferase [Lasiosphaeria miniovina]KAK0727060.1 formyl transferase [Lasiosphaeria miniovina]